jgi:cell division protein FtsL
MSEGETLTKMTVYLGIAKSSGLGRKKTKKNRNRSKVRLGKKRVDFASLIPMLFGVLVVLILFYAFTINRVATAGYDIKVMEKEIRDLKNGNDELKIKISELKSMAILEDKALEMGMKKPEKVDYLNVTAGLALKQ